ncbi:integrase core domain-containing protein [Cellulosilyticum sp. I15G10I2]|uniref:integrase core domain-containing protein n=1 Tax=Cellulosilyticum sp. I15G10I2 TaxID=1892843 RepID=UPI001495A48C|nr:integrase core domain-containing protein [Cellulosilyticum sp. I15G10I2]
MSNDNPFAESLFKTLKNRCNYQPKGFSSLEEARKWVYNFVEWYNNNHRHSGISFLTPNQRHASDHGLNALKKRELVCKSAKLKHPERWTTTTRNWSIEDRVYLNPDKSEESDTKKDQGANAS